MLDRDSRLRGRCTAYGRNAPVDERPCTKPEIEDPWWTGSTRVEEPAAFRRHFIDMLERTDARNGNERVCLTDLGRAIAAFGGSSRRCEGGGEPSLETVDLVCAHEHARSDVMACCSKLVPRGKWTRPPLWWSCKPCASHRYGQREGGRRVPSAVRLSENYMGRQRHRARHRLRAHVHRSRG